MSEVLERITENTLVWVPNLDIALPINSTDIPAFKKWVEWNGIHRGHEGYDFAAYIDEKGECVLGLPSETKVRAVADGIVSCVVYPHTYGRPYSSNVYIDHGKMDMGMQSFYVHVLPLVEYGQSVKKGDVIGTLYSDPPGAEWGQLVHLHFALFNGGRIRPRLVNPSEIFPELSELVAEPQGRRRFTIRQLEVQPQFRIANFDYLLLN